MESEKGLLMTGVKATPEELKELKDLLKNARETPVMVLGGVDVSARAWQRMQERCHAIALSHGLPEIEGFYGITQDGEFVRCEVEG